MAEQENKKPVIVLQGRLRGPGPAVYALPTTIGTTNHAPNKNRYPAYSFGARPKDRYPDGPGPAYMVNGMTSKGSSVGRTATLKGRLKDRPIEKTPGPGTYNLHGPEGSSKNGPACTISPRIRFKPIDNSPGPLAYSVPTLLGDKVPHQKRAPAVTMYGRNEKFGFSHDYAKTPGPAAYSRPDNGNSQRPQVITLKGRNFMPSPKNNTPGPGTYQDTSYHLKRSPRHAMGIRHSDLTVPLIEQADD